MFKHNNLISEVKLERLGADILMTYLSKFNLDDTHTYIGEENVSENVLSSIANSMITNHFMQLVDFLLWKQSYKKEMEDTTYQSIINTIKENLTDELNDCIWDEDTKKYLLRTLKNSTDSDLELVDKVIDYIFDYYSDSPYMFVRKRDIKLDLNKSNDKAFYDRILTILNKNIEISSLNFDKLIYSIIPILNEFLKSKGYYFDKNQNRYYIPIDEDKKHSILKNILDSNFIVYSENEYEFIVSTNKGNKELYINCCSQYTISDEDVAYHYNEEEEFLLALDKISVTKIPFLEQKKITLEKSLIQNNIHYSIEDGLNEFIVDTNDGPLTLYIDSNGFYCLEDSDGYGYFEKSIEDFIKPIKKIYPNDNTKNDTKISSSYIRLECNTYFNNKHNWVLHETRTFNDSEERACIDVHLEILDLNNSMKIVYDEELNKLGYNDICDVDWVVINQSSNRITN